MLDGSEHQITNILAADATGGGSVLIRLAIPHSTACFGRVEPGGFLKVSRWSRAGCGSITRLRKWPRLCAVQDSPAEDSDYSAGLDPKAGWVASGGEWLHEIEHDGFRVIAPVLPSTNLNGDKENSKFISDPLFAYHEI